MFAFKNSKCVLSFCLVVCGFSAQAQHGARSSRGSLGPELESAREILHKDWPLGKRFRVVDASGDEGTFCSFQKNHIVSMSLDSESNLNVDPVDPSQAVVPVYGEEGQVGTFSGTTLYMRKVTRKHVPRDTDWDTRDYTLNSTVTSDKIVNEIANKNFGVIRKWGTKTILKKNADGSISVSVNRKLATLGDGSPLKATCRLVPLP